MTEDSGLSRSLSFPNFFHSLLDFHHIDDFNAYDDDFTLSNNDCERLKKDTIDNNNNDNSNDDRSRQLIVKADSTAVLMRCDTWAGGFTSVEDTLDVSAVERDIANTADKLKTLAQNTVSTDATFSTSVADKSVANVAKATDVTADNCNSNLPTLRQLVPSEITPVQAKSAIISTLASRYRKSPSSVAETSPTPNDRLAQEGVMDANDISRKERKRGILGLASRLNVTPRELNMMSPSSF